MTEPRPVPASPSPRPALELTYGHGPGPGTALVVGPIGLLIDLPADDERVVAGLAALVQRRTPEAALDALAERGLSQMPSFGLVAFGPDGARVIVRGRVTAVGPGQAPIVSAGLMAESALAEGQAVQLRLADCQVGALGRLLVGPAALSSAGWLSVDPTPGSVRSDPVDPVLGSVRSDSVDPTFGSVRSDSVDPALSSVRSDSVVLPGGADAAGLAVPAPPRPAPAGSAALSWLAEPTPATGPARIPASDPGPAPAAGLTAAAREPVPGPTAESVPESAPDPAPEPISAVAAAPAAGAAPADRPAGSPTPERAPAGAPALPVEPEAESESGATGFAHLFNATMGAPPELTETAAPAVAAPGRADQAAAVAAETDAAVAADVDSAGSAAALKGLGMTQVAPATASLSEIAALAGPAPAAAPSPATALAQADRPPAAAPPPGGFIASFEWRPTGSSVSIDLPGSQVSVQPAPILSWPPPAGSEVPAPAGATDQFAPGPSPAGWAGSPDSPPPAGGPTGLPASPLASASAGPALPPARLDRLSSEPGPGPEAIAIEACGPIVGAVVCPAGHLNPPYADICRVCRQPVPQQQPIELPRPSLGVLRLSSGGVVNLDRGAVLGRNPRPLAGVTGLQPNLIRIADANRDISGQHLEVRLEDWFVTVRDLGSTNGTQVIAPDRPPVTLRAHEPVSVEPGTRVVLANAFDFLFEALP